MTDLIGSSELIDSITEQLKDADWRKEFQSWALERGKFKLADNPDMVAIFAKDEITKEDVKNMLVEIGRRAAPPTLLNQVAPMADDTALGYATDYFKLHAAGYFSIKPPETAAEIPKTGAVAVGEIKSFGMKDVITEQQAGKLADGLESRRTEIRNVILEGVQFNGTKLSPGFVESVADVNGHITKAIEAVRARDADAATSLISEASEHLTPEAQAKLIEIFKQETEKVLRETALKVDESPKVSAAPKL